MSEAFLPQIVSGAGGGLIFEKAEEYSISSTFSSSYMSGNNRCYVASLSAYMKATIMESAVYVIHHAQLIVSVTSVINNMSKEVTDCAGSITMQPYTYESEDSFPCAGPSQWKSLNPVVKGDVIVLDLAPIIYASTPSNKNYWPSLRLSVYANNSNYRIMSSNRITGTLTRYDLAFD